MININQTSENSKIYIQRNITNDEPVINNYVTEDELQEQLKNINIPYLVIDHIKYDDGTWGYGIVSGDFDKVYDAIVNRKPQIMYVPDQQPNVFYIPTVFMCDTSTKKIWVSVSHHNAVDLDITYYTFEITENLVTQSRQKRNVQEKLVSGENIKTINGNDILGEGDIKIDVDLSGYATEQWVNDKGYIKEIPDEYVTETELNDALANVGNGNIVELTQSEYDNITPEDDTLYVISDAPAVDTSEFITESELNSKGYTTSNSFKTINNQSIVGSGNITIAGGSGSEPLYLWKETGPNFDSQKLVENANIYKYITSLYPSENYPLLVLRDAWNDTICNNVWSNGNSVEIQCCNSRIRGSRVELTDERFYLQSNGKLSNIESKNLATKNYVDEQLGNINNVLENIIG